MYSSSWKRGIFAASYLASLATPVVIGIVQNVYYDSTLSVFLFVCDVMFLIDLNLCWIHRNQSESSRSSSSSFSNGFNVISLRDICIRAVSASCIVVLPLCSAFGLCGMDIAWFSLLRMVSTSRLHLQRFCRAIFLSNCALLCLYTVN
jgi:hypothetical protein